jgi:hypothetical protein
MVKKVVDYYEVNVKMLIRKDFWDADNPEISNELVASKVQSGIEVPIESMDVVVKE